MMTTVTMRHVCTSGILPCALFLLLGTPIATATEVYRCVDKRGQVSYQDMPCAEARHQQRMSLADSNVTTNPPPAPAVSVLMPAPAAVTAPARQPQKSLVPLPTMFSCTRATDGKPYLSANGDPPPYLVPLAMLDMLPSSISQTYGAGNHAGRTRPDADMIAGSYTQVQDQCRQLTPWETCQALRDAYEENTHKLQRAFKSEQPPLEQRDEELRAQLAGC